MAVYEVKDDWKRSVLVQRMKLKLELVDEAGRLLTLMYLNGFGEETETGAPSC